MDHTRLLNRIREPDALGVSLDCVLNDRWVARDYYDYFDVEWAAGKDGQTEFDVKVVLEVEDQQGLLAKIVSVVSEQKTNIRNVEARTYETRDAQIEMTIVVSDRKHMERIFSRMRRIKGVRAVERALN